MTANRSYSQPARGSAFPKFIERFCSPPGPAWKGVAAGNRGLAIRKAINFRQPSVPKQQAQDAAGNGGRCRVLAGNKRPDLEWGCTGRLPGGSGEKKGI